MIKQFFWAITLLLLPLSYPTSQSVRMTSIKETIELFKNNSTRGFLRDSQQQQTRKRILIGIIAGIGIAVPLVVYLLLKFFRSQSSSRITAKQFQDALIKATESPVSPYDFTQFQLMRKRVGADILNQSLPGGASPLAYILLKQNTPNPTPTLKALIDPNNQSSSRIIVKEEALIEVMNRVDKYHYITANLELLKSIMPKVQLELLNKKLFINFKSDSIPSTIQGASCTALDYFIQKKDLDVVNILLSKPDYVSAQMLPNTADGLQRAIRLAKLGADYKQYLDLSLTNASEELLNTPSFTIDFLHLPSSGENTLYTLMELATIAVNSNISHQVYADILNNLLTNSQKVNVTALSMIKLLHPIQQQRHDQALVWFTKMRKRATTAVLSEVLDTLLKMYAYDKKFLNQILNLLVSHEETEQPTQIDEKILIYAKHPRLRKEIFSKFEFVPDLVNRTIQGQNLIVFLTEKILKGDYSREYSYILFKILEKDQYKTQLLLPTAKGLKLAIALAIVDKEYLKYLKTIIDTIDINILSKPLFGVLETQNIFEHILQRQEKEILEVILSNKKYRKELFSQNEAGFEKAVKVGVQTPLYHDDLKVIYAQNRTLLTKTIFNDQQEHVLDYAIGYKSKPLIKLLLKDTANFFDKSDESFIRAVKLAIIDEDFLPYLKKQLTNTNINSLLNKRLFSTNILYDKNTNIEIFKDDDDIKLTDQVKGLIAFDYAIEEKAIHVIDTLLNIPPYKKTLLSKRLGLKRLLLMIEELGEKYINTLQEVRLNFTKKILNAKLFWNGQTALERVLSLYHSVLVNHNKEQASIKQSNLDKVVDILLDSSPSSHQPTITQSTFKKAFDLAKLKYFEPLKKIREKASQELLNQLLCEHALDANDA